MDKPVSLLETVPYIKKGQYYTFWRELLDAPRDAKLRFAKGTPGVRYLFRVIRLSVHACCALESYGKSQSKLNHECTDVCADTYWWRRYISSVVLAASGRGVGFPRLRSKCDVLLT